ncbi:MAG: purine-nucleoside phosphorylase, partial [Myxococcales bacterium]|nr:purine-nucleoside phosphorylase [Myxococcales bacterium]
GDIPNFPVSTVAGHAGRLIVGNKGDVCCAAMQGRVHFYEGHNAATLVFPARTLITLGVDTLIVTNAAGGIGHDPGTLMLITDHINLMPDNPLRGVNDERLGPRFPDMSNTYNKELRELALGAGKAIGVELAEGVYAGLPGPSYETPAEIRMLRTMGASAAGMSTVPEAIAANHMGAKVLGISCITNKAAGLSEQPLSHKEVTDTAREVHSTFIGLLDSTINAIGDSRA